MRSLCLSSGFFDFIAELILLLALTFSTRIFRFALWSVSLNGLIFGLLGDFLLAMLFSCGLCRLLGTLFRLLGWCFD